MIVSIQSLYFPVSQDPSIRLTLSVWKDLKGTFPLDSASLKAINLK